MKLAASALGWDHPRDIVSRMDVSETTVYRWWSGERLPADDRMEEYAALVGTDVATFFGEYLLSEDVTEVILGVPSADWLRLTDEERASIRLFVRGFAEFHRLEAAVAASVPPGAG